jgi:hypothetical protein
MRNLNVFICNYLLRPLPLLIAFADEQFDLVYCVEVIQRRIPTRFAESVMSLGQLK